MKMMQSQRHALEKAKGSDPVELSPQSMQIVLNEFGASGWELVAVSMGADDLLCSRNARPLKALVGRAQWKINQPPSPKR